MNHRQGIFWLVILSLSVWHPGFTLAQQDLDPLLHADIQDIFNEHGVQIMSPHYLQDAEQLKVVPKEKWFAAPADKNEGRV